jgi:hypothetical protein
MLATIVAGQAGEQEEFSLMHKNIGLFLDGAWRDGGGHGRIDVVDPGTGEALGTVPAAGSSFEGAK